MQAADAQHRQTERMNESRSCMKFSADGVIAVLRVALSTKFQSECGDSPVPAQGTSRAFPPLRQKRAARMGHPSIVLDGNLTLEGEAGRQLNFAVAVHLCRFNLAEV